jgi:hypothetical protein
LDNWKWPKGTFFQRRLEEVRARQIEESPNDKAGADENERLQRAITASTSKQPKLFVLHDVLTPAEVNARPSRMIDNMSSNRTDNGTTAAPEDLVPIDLRRLGKKPSPTQALLALEREGWARVTNGEFRRVEANEKSVPAALHKENLEKFQSGLVHSGEWIRFTPSDAEPARIAKLKVENVSEASWSKVEIAEPDHLELAAVISPPAANEPMIPDLALQSGEENRAGPDNTQASHDQWGQLGREKFDPSAPQAIEWQDIDKLLWLAKPSS